MLAVRNLFGAAPSRPMPAPLAGLDAHDRPHPSRSPTLRHLLTGRAQLQSHRLLPWADRRSGECFCQVVASPTVAAYVPHMFDVAFSLPVMAGRQKTARGASRQTEIAMARPGDALTLRRENGTRGGRPMVGVYSDRGEQMGYISPDRAQDVAGLVAVARAIFRRADTFGCVIDITVDGSTPALPATARQPDRQARPQVEARRDEFASIFPIAARRRAYAVGDPTRRTSATDLFHSDKSLYAAGGRA